MRRTITRKTIDQTIRLAEAVHTIYWSLPAEARAAVRRQFRDDPEVLVMLGDEQIRHPARCDVDECPYDWVIARMDKGICVRRVCAEHRNNVGTQS